MSKDDIRKPASAASACYDGLAREQAAAFEQDWRRGHASQPQRFRQWVPLLRN